MKIIVSLFLSLFTFSALAQQSWQNVSGSTTDIYYPAGGRVGIGVTTPGSIDTSARLDVGGPMQIRANGGIPAYARLTSDYPYIWFEALGFGSSFIQAGINSRGNAVGDYFAFTIPTGKLFLFDSDLVVANGPDNGSGTSGNKQWRIGLETGGTFHLRDVNAPACGGCNGLTNGDRMTIDGSGNTKFAGNVTAVNITAQYQDIAEWVPAAGKLSAGTVVVIDGEDSNRVRTSSRPYDTSVAGVVSPNPGMTLGVPGESKALIATTGRVRVHVDAHERPVARGDLLVTSDRPGVAMASVPLEVGGVKMHRPGTVIGKALEPLPGGEGDILVLLSLQ